MNFLVFYFLLLFSCIACADVPGNKPRSSYDVKIFGLQQYKDYTFYAQDYDSPVIIKDSNVLHIQGGFGAPQCTDIWAVNNKTNLHTDTLYFCSGDERKSIAIQLQISDNHLTYQKQTTIKKGEADFFINDIDTTSNSQSNQYIMYLISAFSLLVMLGLVFFVWNKKREFRNQKLI